MYDFITDLFNIDKKMIRNIEVYSSKNFTRFRKHCLLSLNRNVFYSINDQLKSDKYTKDKKENNYI